jgi:hypothetical protein
MEQQQVSVTKFRFSPVVYSLKVAQGKKELVVTHYYKTLFKVIKLQGESSVAVSLTYMRTHITEFLALLDEHSEVILINRGKPFVKCVKVNNA